jgi:hypothetical protein
MSREYTKDEVREMFLSNLKGIVNYWAKLPDKTPKEKLEGLAFTILAEIDGSSSTIPTFILAPLPNEADKEYYIDKGKNYYPENHNSNVKCDIAGNLHHLWHEYK